MISTPVRVVAAALGLATAAALAACGTQTPEEEKGGGAIAVDASDDACEVARGEADAGTITFEVTNKGSRVTEFYLYAEGDRIMGEVENITPGLTRRLIVEVSEGGKYETACKPGMQGKGIRDAFKVTGQADKQVDTDTRAGRGDQELPALRELAVRRTARPRPRSSSTRSRARRSTRPRRCSRSPASTGSGSSRSRRASATSTRRSTAARTSSSEGMKFTGYHRLEKDLWVDGLQADSPAIADQLQTDIEDLVSRAKTLELTPLQLANGAKELLDEVATGKITGEEDRYSHTDLWDFRSNVDGSKAAIAALRPVIEERDARAGVHFGRAVRRGGRRAGEAPRR